MNVRDLNSESDSPDDTPNQPSGGNPTSGNDEMSIKFESVDGTFQIDDELPCGHESIPEDTPEPPFLMTCDVCGGTWRVSGL